MTSSNAQKAKENAEKLTAWIAERDAQQDFVEYERQGKINRQALCEELDFSRSVVTQNPAVKQLIADAEARWYDTQLLDSKAHDAARERSEKRVAQTNADVSLLQDELAKLKAENAALKRALQKYAAMDEVIQATGYSPR